MTFRFIPLFIFVSIFCQQSFCQKEYALDSLNSKESESSILLVNKSVKEEGFTSKNNKRYNGFYFGSSTGYTKVNGADAFHTSISFMSYLDHYFGIGIKGKLFFSEIVNLDGEYYDETISYASGYAGFSFEPVIFSSNPVHVAVPFFVGAGAFSYTHSGEYYDVVDRRRYSSGSSFSKSPSTAVLVLEPGLDVEWNALQWLRIGLGCSYRFFKNIDDDPNPFTANSNGLNYALTLKMGWF